MKKHDSQTTFQFVVLLLLVGFFVLDATGALAGTGGADVADLYNKIREYLTGMLGKCIGILAFIAGIARSAITESPKGIVFGFLVCLGVWFAPLYLDKLITGTLPLPW